MNNRVRERRKMSSIILYKVVQKIKYGRLFVRFSFTKLDVGDGMLASRQLEFQIAIIAEKCLSQCSFLHHLHMIVYVTIIFYIYIWPSFTGKLCFFSWLAHFVMISIIVSYLFNLKIGLQTNSSWFLFIYIYQHILSHRIISITIINILH
jgi:hypothetical protein